MDEAARRRMMKLAKKKRRIARPSNLALRIRLACTDHPRPVKLVAVAVLKAHAASRNCSSDNAKTFAIMRRRIDNLLNQQLYWL